MLRIVTYRAFEEVTAGPRGGTSNELWGSGSTIFDVIDSQRIWEDNCLGIADPRDVDGNGCHSRSKGGMQGLIGEPNSVFCLEAELVKVRVGMKVKEGKQFKVTELEEKKANVRSSLRSKEGDSIGEDSRAVPVLLVRKHRYHACGLSKRFFIPQFADKEL